MRIEDLIKRFHKWVVSVVGLRLSNTEKSRDWVYKDLEYKEELKLEEFQKFFERDELNAEYMKRYENQNIKSKKPHAWYQTEINMIYSLHKCFAMRNATRLQYYRNDMSQKAKRSLTAVNQAIGKFKTNSAIAEKEPR